MRAKNVSDFMNENGAVAVGIGSGGMVGSGNKRIKTPQSSHSYTHKREREFIEKEENLDLADLSGEFMDDDDDEMNEFQQGLDPYKTMGLGFPKGLKIGDIIKSNYHIGWDEGKETWEILTDVPPGRPYRINSTWEITDINTSLDEFMGGFGDKPELGIIVKSLAETHDSQGNKLYIPSNWFSYDSVLKLMEKVKPEQVNEFKQGGDPYNIMGLGGFNSVVEGSTIEVVQQIYWNSYSSAYTSEIISMNTGAGKKNSLRFPIGTKLRYIKGYSDDSWPFYWSTYDDYLAFFMPHQFVLENKDLFRLIKL
jgi:hypothetical protein